MRPIGALVLLQAARANWTIFDACLHGKGDGVCDRSLNHSERANALVASLNVSEKGALLAGSQDPCVAVYRGRGGLPSTRVENHRGGGGLPSTDRARKWTTQS